MDVAIVATARFPITEPAAGGLEVHTRVLATELLARGHRVTVYAAGGDGPFEVEVMLPVDFTGSETARRDVAAPPATLLSEHHSYLDAMLRIADADHDVVHVNAIHYLPFVSSAMVAAPMVGHVAQPADAMAGVGDGAGPARPPAAVADLGVRSPTPGRGAAASSTR